jgi:ubiquinone biosynthesis protein
MRMTTAARTRAGRDGRRAIVEEALRDLRWPPARRAAPPEGRLGAADYPVARLRAALTALGPLFADFGRYLSSRPDLLPRRHCAELALIADTGSATDPRVLAAHLQRELGGPLSRHFVEFDAVPSHVTRWTERHQARIAADVPVLVTIVRPDAAEWIERDAPLLPLLADCLALDGEALAAAIDDYSHTLRVRLDQTVQSAALATLAGDAPEVAGFHAPACYRDLCTTSVLTTGRAGGTELGALMRREALHDEDRTDLARRLAAAWLRQTLGGRVVPFDVTTDDIVIADERIVLLSGACEPHTSRQRVRFSRYMNAVAADDPDSAASWIVDAADGEEVPAAREEALKRRFRQAVPFRDGEWSGDERLAEYILVQWRAARESGWHLTPYHVHLYRGLAAIAAIADRLAPAQDSMLVALQDARLLLGASDAAQLLTPASIATRLENVLREMVSLPQKLDDVLTLAAEGRLRVRLQVPASGEGRRVKQQTVQLVAALVLLVAVASLVRHAAPAYGPMVERVGSLVLLAVGGWLLVAAARL